MKLKEGDIFKIPIDDIKFGLGQIVNISNKDSLSVIVFEEVFDNSTILNLELLIQELRPFLFANTFDAKFYHKHWIVVDNKPVNYISPFYKIGEDPVYIVDLAGKKIRKASLIEKETLEFKKYVAPVRVENAYLSYHGKREWNDELYKSLLYSYNIISDKLLNTKI